MDFLSFLLKVALDIRIRKFAVPCLPCVDFDIDLTEPRTWKEIVI